DGCECDRLLEDRTPAVARRLADLAAAGKDRNRRAIDGGRDCWRQALRVVQLLDVVPVQLQADEPSLGAAGPLLALERETTDEIALVEADKPPEPDLERRVVLLGIERMAGRRVVHLDEDEPGLEPSHVEGEHARRPD